MDHGIVSLFPSLFAYQFLAIGVLRMAMGAVTFFAGYRHLSTRTEKSASQTKKTSSLAKMSVGALLVVAGLLLILGLYTQAAAIVASILWVGAAIVSLKRRESLPQFATIYFFVALVSLSFLFLGPGAFAIDLPL